MKSKFIIKNVLAFLLQAVLFYALNNDNAPLSVSLFAAVVICDVGVLLPAVAFIIAFLKYKSLIMLADAFITAAGVILIYSIYKKRGKKPSVESILYVFLSQAVYIAFYQGEIINKLVYTAIITVFYFVCQVAVNTVVYKNFIAKPTVYEAASVAAVFSVCSIGVLGIAGTNVYRAISVFILLFAVRLYKSPSAMPVACVLALPVAIFSGDLSYFAYYCAAFFAAFVFAEYVGVLSALSVVATDVAFAFLLKFYADYGYIEALFTFLPAFVFALIPSRLYETITEKGYMCGDRLVRQTVARVKSNLSGKIYDLAGAFSEMNGALSVLSEQNEQKKTAIKKISRASVARACNKCSQYRLCELTDGRALFKLIDLGLNKGRLTLVDLPKEYLDGCINPNPLIFEINRLIDGYNARMEQLKKADDLKRILSVSVLGVERRLSELAFELSQSTQSDKKQEKRLTEFLLRRGVKTFGVSVCGDTDVIVSLIVKEKADDDKIISYIDQFTSTETEVTSEQKILNGLKFLEIKKRYPMQAAFGVSAMTKTDSPYSGDVHSLLKLDGGKFLVALSDGMGSGEGALSTSSASIGLIEGMLKAGLKPNVVLPIVNEIVSVSTEDNFSAIDIGIVDLNEKTFDFIKIGAPYGFILSDEGIRYIEGSSLPIGILSEIKPTTAHAGAQSGDILIMSSDGITDAFGSSTDFVEFLKGAPSKNPQALADTVLKEALSRTGGIATDDMTCLCVRLFENHGAA